MRRFRTLCGDSEKVPGERAPPCFFCSAKVVGICKTPPPPLPTPYTHTHIAAQTTTYLATNDKQNRTKIRPVWRVHRCFVWFVCVCVCGWVGGWVVGWCVGLGARCTACACKCNTVTPVQASLAEGEDAREAEGRWATEEVSMCLHVRL